MHYSQDEAPTDVLAPARGQSPAAHSPANPRRKAALIAAAGVLLVGGVVGTAFALSGGGGPTHLAGDTSSTSPSASASPTEPASTQASTTAPAAPSPTVDAQQQIIDAAYAITHEQSYPYRYKSTGANPGCNRQPPDLYPKASWQYSTPIDRVDLSGNAPAELTLRNKFGDYAGQNLELDVRAIVISPAGHRSYENGHVSGSNEVSFDYPRSFTYDTGTEWGTYTVLWVDTQGRPLVCGGFVAS